MRVLAALALLAFAAPVRAADAPAVDVIEHLGSPLPDGLEFQDAAGLPVRWGTAVHGDLPTLLVLSSYECPMLCGLVLHGLVDAVLAAGLRPGRDLRLVTVSFDRRDTPESARKKQENALEALHDVGHPEDWPFLVGRPSTVEALTAAVGFQVAYEPTTAQYLHPAAVVVLTPEGRISRYLYGIQFPPRDLRLALAEARAGRSGPSFDRLLLVCFTYDPATQRYVVAPHQLMSLAASLLALVVTALVGRTCWRDLRPPRNGGAGGRAGAAPPDDASRVA